MYFLKITKVPLSAIKNGNQRLIIKYKLASLPDIPSNYTVASEDLAVLQDGTLVQPLFIEVEHYGSYTVWSTSKCNPTGGVKVTFTNSPTTAAPTTIPPTTMATTIPPTTVITTSAPTTASPTTVPATTTVGGCGIVLSDIEIEPIDDGSFGTAYNATWINTGGFPTSVIVEVSLDGGATWVVPTTGSLISGTSITYSLFVIDNINISHLFRITPVCSNGNTGETVVKSYEATGVILRNGWPLGEQIMIARVFIDGSTLVVFIPRLDVNGHQSNLSGIDTSPHIFGIFINNNSGSPRLESRMRHIRGGTTLQTKIFDPSTTGTVSFSSASVFIDGDLVLVDRNPEGTTTIPATTSAPTTAPPTTVPATTTVAMWGTCYSFEVPDGSPESNLWIEFTREVGGSNTPVSGRINLILLAESTGGGVMYSLCSKTAPVFRENSGGPIITPSTFTVVSGGSCTLDNQCS